MSDADHHRRPAARSYGPAVQPDHVTDDMLPRLVETDWRDDLPLRQGELADRTRRPGYREIGSPPCAVFWYREEDDTVVLHHNDRMTGPVRADVYRKIAVLRRQIANGNLPAN